MGSKWQVRPVEVQKDLVWTDPDGNQHPFWIKLKKHLTVGESRRVMTAGWRGMKQAEATHDDAPKQAEIQIDWRAQTFARTETYVTEWSLEDDNGRRLARTREQIEALHPELYELIEDAITEHVEEMDAEKKSRSGSSSPSQTSA